MNSFVKRILDSVMVKKENPLKIAQERYHKERVFSSRLQVTNNSLKERVETLEKIIAGHEKTAGFLNYKAMHMRIVRQRREIERLITEVKRLNQAIIREKGKNK